MIQRSPTGIRPTSRRWPGIPAVTGRPSGDRVVYVWLAELKFRTVAHGPPCRDRQAADRRPTDEWIFVTSADHQAKFNWELKWLGHRPMSKGWALQECLFRWRPPDFCRIWCKTRCAAIRWSIFLYWDGGLRQDVLTLNRPVDTRYTRYKIQQDTRYKLQEFYFGITDWPQIDHYFSITDWDHSQMLLLQWEKLRDWNVFVFVFEYMYLYLVQINRAYLYLYLKCCHNWHLYLYLYLIIVFDPNLALHISKQW